MNNDYKKEYLKTCDTINEMILAKWPNVGAHGHTPFEGSSPAGNETALSWAETNAPELYKQEERLDARINVLWMNAIDFEAFKKKVVDWGRTVLKIYKEYSEVMKDSASRLGGPEVMSRPEPVGANCSSHT